VTFSQVLRGLGLPEPVAEHRFHPDRRWRFDYAWLDFKVALEVEGGVWVGGRHTRGAGFVNDMDKYSEAAILGWCVLRVTPSDLLKTGVVLVARALIIRGWSAPDAVKLAIETNHDAKHAKRKKEDCIGKKTLS
jgi:hypothetical protein